MKKFIIPILALSFLASCSSSSYTYRSSNIAKNEVLAQQVIVDVKLDVKNKVTATSSKRNSVDEAMDEAYYKAIVDNNIDVIVDPIFEVNTSDKVLFFGGKSTAKLTGFGAKYENARNKIDAIKELKTVDTTDMNKFNSLYGSSKVEKNNNGKPSSSMKKKTKWWLWGAIAAAVYFLVG
jgi:hypothetical protein